MTEARPVIIDVKGMTCQGCVNAVTKIAKRADPQADVKIDLVSGRVDVKTGVAPEVIAKAISAGGYEASVR